MVAKNEHGDEPVKVTDKSNSWLLLPPRPGLCQTCAKAHRPELPHDPESLYYQTKFNMEHGRIPTWDDAMAHCSEATKAEWWRVIKEIKGGAAPT